jgi:hypothetical protein
MTSASPQALWQSCVDQLKNRVNNLPFWEALELCVPIAIDDGVLVVGLDSAHLNKLAYLQQPANFATINEVISVTFNAPLTAKFIEGTTVGDWEIARARDARVAAMKASGAKQAVQKDTAVSGWEDLYEVVARLYAQCVNRALPQGKARYASDALYAVLDAMDTLYAKPDEIAERGLARVLERIANASEIPASVLAFELERLRAWKSANPDG